MRNNYDFTIISAVYNSASYLPEMINSIVGQTIGFEDHVQLILVNDGSGDNSVEICRKYEELYPDNILVIDKENGGVSSARNAGLKYIRGKYLNFIDSDDMLSPTALEDVKRAFEKWGDETDVVNIPFVYFDGAIGGENHPQNKKFDKGTRLVNLEYDYKISIMNVTFSFMRADAAQGILFDESICIGEDLKFINTILLKKRTVGLLSSCKYYYRKHSDGSPSLISSKIFLKEYYIPQLKNLTLWAYQYSMETYGEYPLFLQYTIACDFQEKIRQTVHFKSVLRDDLPEYLALMDEAFGTFDDSIILNLGLISKEYKIFWLSKKYHKYPTVKFFKSKLSYEFEYDVPSDISDPENSQFDKKTVSVDWMGTFHVNTVRIRNGVIHISGNVAVIPYSDNLDSLNVYIKAYNHLFKVTFTGAEDACMYLDKDIVYTRKYFYVDIPLENSIANNFSCWCSREGDRPSMLNYVTFGNFCSVGKDVHNQVYIKDGFVVCSSKNGIYVSYKGKKEAKKAYKTYLAYLKKNNCKYVWYRRIIKIASLFVHKKIWLISDRKEAAGDNGEAFFRYLSEKKPRGILPYYVISADSPDYIRLKKKYRRVVAQGSKLHKLLYVLSDANISAHFDPDILLPVEYPYFRDVIADKKTVFLQHGVTKDDIHSIYSAYRQNLSLFICASDKERSSIVSIPGYGLGEKGAISTGFARFDYLENKEKNIITIMPTWRKYLFSGMGPDGKWILKKNIENTSFFKFYSALLSDKRLISASKEYGYELCFAPHVNVFSFIDRLDIDPSVRIIPQPIDYNSIFSESSLMVTDYSSTAFDFAYMHKPVVYAQFDASQFFESHTYKKGYFSYENDGFGEVTSDLDSTIDTLIEYMKNKCKMKPEYSARVDNFFAYNDKNNCQRIMEAICGMDDMKRSNPPKFNDKKIIPVVLATNEKYAPFVSVTVQSLIYNSDLRYFYDIYVLNSGLSKDAVRGLSCKTVNYSITCLDVSSDISPHMELLQQNAAYISKETYYRILIPSILKQYDKVLYIDCDLIVLEDISEMYFTDIGDCLIGGVRNPLHAKMEEHIEKDLGLESRKYINAGVLLMNTEQMRKDSFEEKCFDLLASGRELRFMDQDVINLVCAGRIYYFPMQWNYEWHFERLNTFRDKKYHLLESEIEEYKNAAHDIKILHYTGDIKPWNNSKLRFGEIFWDYAKKSSYYRDILLSSPLNPIYRKYINAEEEIQNIRKSFSYRLGRFLTFPLRALRSLLSKLTKRK